ncbi:MAG: ribokinase [Actinomycetota bacterium]|nr:ribokinase [Actinomycetota bacterium]
MAKVTVVGSFVVGLTLRVDRFPVSGETVLARDFDLGPGGKGSNQAVQIARLGADVQFVSLIGTDDFSRIAIDLYAQEGVGTDYLARTSETNTGVGFIILDAAGDNRILLAPGTNDLFKPEHVADASAAFEGATVVIAQLEIPSDTAIEGLRRGREAGATSILNPAPVRPLAKDAFANIDILTPNQTEARVILGLEPDDPADDMEICDKLLGLGVGTIVLTRGEEGATIVTNDGSESISSFKVEVVDSTGAGDAFNGTLATSLARGDDLRSAVKRACAGGALACTKLGVIPALPNETQVDELLADHR